MSLVRLDDGFLLENAAYRVRVSAKGKVESVLLKHADRELLRRPLAYELQRERPFEFPAWNMDWRDRKRGPWRRIEGGGEVEVLEEGPLRVTLRLRFAFMGSTLLRDIGLHAGGDTVDFVERIEWRGKGVSLKLALDTALEGPEVTSNWETARMRREVNHARLYEFPSRLWADISDARGGVSLIEDSKYGYDRPTPTSLRMTLLYTPAIWYLNGFWDQRSQDWGSHTIRWALYGHAGDWRGTDGLARRHNQPIQVFRLEPCPDGPAPGQGGHELAFLDVSDPQVGIHAVKRAEEGEGILVRLYERQGRDGEGALRFGLPIRSVHEVNGLEEGEEVPSPEGRTFPFRMRANGMKSFVFNLEGAAAESRMAQVALDFPRDSALAAMEGEGAAVGIPPEVLPSRLEIGGIRFALAGSTEDRSQAQALACDGQVIALPPGLRRLSVLLAAVQVPAGQASGTCESREADKAGGAHEARFAFVAEDGGELAVRTRRVPALLGFLGQWDRRLWKRVPRHAARLGRDYAWLNPCVGIEPGHLDRGRLAWFCTHTRGADGARPYRFGYLHLIELGIPDGATSVVMPKDKAVLVAAMSASSPAAIARSVRHLADRWDY